MFIQNDTLADVCFTLCWGKNNITHQDAYRVPELNFWQDYLPESIKKEIEGKSNGYKTTMRLNPGDILPLYSNDLVKILKPSQLDLSRIACGKGYPGRGRFYPKGIISGLGGIYCQNVVPFRFIQQDGEKAIVDLNHPLAGISMELDIEIIDVKQNDRKYGGTSVDWIDLLVTGPGIQARFENRPTEFFCEDSFTREDSSPDDGFYAKERMVSHIDEMAQCLLKGLYSKLLKKDTVVLDLMSSWQSHLPDDLPLQHLAGLGLNAKEMRENPRLSDFVVHDLNQKPFLPYAGNNFDAVICSLSVEYLAHPFEIFREVQRVLKPGGPFIVTFSNRWFPPKAINLWKYLHEFERLAMVTDYFLESGGFNHICTLSERGYPRPYTDKYFPEFKYADPVYAVWGTCVQG